MRSAVFIAVAFYLSATALAGPVSAQPSAQGAKDLQPTPRAETDGGEPNKPAPHIYKLGEHLSEAYGRYDLVDDWERRALKKPPDGYHWIRYGDNYLLVKTTDGLIAQIAAAS